MIHDIPKPEISPNFSIDDIRKLREWNYERLKDASIEEYLTDSRKEMEKFNNLISAAANC
ncbi:MAG: hypothetical protein FWF73_04425 [Spirochaetes bacterium]|nr:hypothetical protein [Spirochaetota bacterium]